MGLRRATYLMIALLSKHNSISNSPSQPPHVPVLAIHLSFIRRMSIGRIDFIFNLAFFSVLFFMFIRLWISTRTFIFIIVLSSFIFMVFFMLSSFIVFLFSFIFVFYFLFLLLSSLPLYRHSRKQAETGCPTADRRPLFRCTVSGASRGPGNWQAFTVLI
jgi:hypothetical protein